MKKELNTSEVTTRTVKARSRFRWLKITLTVIASIWLLALVAVQVLLRPNVLKSIADKYIKEYVDANVEIGEISVSVFRSFPNLVVDISGVNVTYPHSRYASYDSIGVDGKLRHAGRGQAGIDTLASFNGLRLSVNYLSAIFGQIHINEASLDRPRIFAHYYGDGQANWNILKNISVSETGDTAVTVLPPVAVNRIALTGRPAVVYTDCPDTIFTAAFFSKMYFHGRLHSRNSARNKLGLRLDSLFVSGRLPKDTLIVAMDHFSVEEDDGTMKFDASARAYAGMSSYGRLVVPLAISGDLSMPKEEVPSFVLRNLRTDVATVSMTGEADVKLYSDSTYVRAEASVDRCSVNDLVHFFGKNFFPESEKLQTNAEVTLTALCDGHYNQSRGTLPELVAEVVVPRSYIRYPGIPDGSLQLDINANTDKDGRLDISLDDMCFIFAGVDLDATGSASDLLGDDPLFSVNAKAEADLDSLSTFLPDSLDLTVRGTVNAALKGSVRASQLTPQDFYRASLDGYVRTDELVLSAPSDSVYLWAGSPSIGIATVKNKLDTGIKIGERILAMNAGIDSLYAEIGDGMKVRMSGLGLVAQSASKAYTESYGKERFPVLGQIDMSRLFVSGADSLFLGTIGMNGTFKYSYRTKGDMMTPLMNLSANISRVFGRYGENKAGFRDAGLTASAVMTTFERNERRDHILDSLQRVYPGVPRDSLFKKAFAGRRRQTEVKSSDFNDWSLSKDLSRTLSKYLREWNLKGDLNIKDGMLITPYFPLRNRIEDFRFTADNEKVLLHNLTFAPGKSDVSARGELTGLRQAVAGRAPMKLDLKITSNSIDANELLAAYSTGSRYVPSNAGSANDQALDDESFMAEVAANEVEVAADSSFALIVVPANVEATVSLEGNEINYSDLNIDWFASDIVMKNRCLQITNTVATSNMGDIYFEGFYSTRSKKDITTGFDLNLADITADKVVQLFPVVDTIMPMLTSFKGQLDCEIAATTDLDTNMNILTPTMNGVLKIKGREVALEDSPEFRKLAKMLMFKDKKFGKVGDMSVSGIVSDNRLEIFPFVLNVDRYVLAMSGLQQFDQTFTYHVSVIKSPLPFRFGINLFGNFDKWKFKIGKAKYKNTNVPVFSAVIDTVQMNLVNSIHNIFTKGVDIAVQSNNQLTSTVEVRKSELGYDSGAGLDSLDVSEQKMIDSLRVASEAPDSLQLVPIPGGTDYDSVEDAVVQSSAKQSRKERRAERRARRNSEAVESETVESE
ncbi:MAG: hypothetical protein PUA96_09825 [Bacteroidales bacterium]|nr:hypothetical protein [Bacteroidales bacterium]